MSSSPGDDNGTSLKSTMDDPLDVDSLVREAMSSFSLDGHPLPPPPPPASQPQMHNCDRYHPTRRFVETPSPPAQDASSVGSSSCGSDSARPRTPPVVPKLVRFSYVIIRNYDITMGDNPAVTAGPPIQLDWEYEEIPSLPVHEFEIFKLKRRTQSSGYIFHGLENRVLTISPDFRVGILLRAGFSEWEISQTVRNVRKIQQQRNRTALTYPFYHVEYAVRSAGRKLQRSAGRRPGSGGGGGNHGRKGGKHHDGGDFVQHQPKSAVHHRHDDEMTTQTDWEDHNSCVFYDDRSAAADHHDPWHH